MDPVSLTRQLVALDTALHAESEAVTMLAPALEGAGFAVDVVEHEPGRGTLVADWSTDLPTPPLCLSGHLDTVPLGAAPWTRDPFTAEPDGDRLYGRGTCDMKAGVAAIVAAAVAVASRPARRAGLRLVLTAAEETGSAGARAAAEYLSGRPSGPLLVAEPTDNRGAFGHKGALWLDAAADGVTAHGSMPHLGENAVTALARAVVNLDEYAFADPPHPVMGPPTLNVGTFHGGLNVNSVPDRAEATVDVRTVAGQEHAVVRQSLSACVGERVRLVPRVDLPPVWTPADDPWATSVAATVSQVTNEPAGEPVAMTYFTDASVLTPALGGVPTVICGPGAPERAHVTDEWCSITRIRELTAVLELACRDWCGQ